MSSRLFPLWMGIEQSHFGVNRIIVPRQPHLDENPMPKSLDGEDHLVIEPVVITVAVAFLRNLSDLRVLLGFHVPDNLSLQEFGSQPLKVWVTANSIRANVIPLDASPEAIPQGLTNKSMFPGVVHLLMASFDRPFSFTEAYTPTCCKSS